MTLKPLIWWKILDFFFPQGLKIEKKLLNGHWNVPAIQQRSVGLNAHWKVTEQWTMPEIQISVNILWGFSHWHLKFYQSFAKNR